MIGHELTHGFDDQGSQFDADGNLRDWWTESGQRGFKKREDCIANEYSGFSPVEGVNLKGGSHWAKMAPTTPAFDWLSWRC